MYDVILKGGHVIDPASKCSEIMDVAISGGKIAAKGKELDTAAVPQEIMADYAAEDADITLQLADVLRVQLEEAGQDRLMREIEFPLVPVLADVEAEGMRVEPEQLLTASEALG